MSANANLRRIVVPIVQGQIRSWMKAHAELRPPQAMIDGVTKRVAGELCAPSVVARIELARSGDGQMMTLRPSTWRYRCAPQVVAGVICGARPSVTNRDAA